MGHRCGGCGGCLWGFKWRGLGHVVRAFEVLGAVPATVIGGLHSGNEGDLVFRAASGFATSEHAPGEGTVALYTYVACGANQDMTGSELL